MTNTEFSNEFDVLYNSITSNQAPGLDEYEKSVFLTKAQDEIVKSYFNPRSNKTQEGFDGNERRQIDFSMIMRSTVYDTISFSYSPTDNPDNKVKLTSLSQIKDALVKQEDGSFLLPSNYTIKESSNFRIISGGPSQTLIRKYIATPFLDSFFDMRDNTQSVTLDNDILMFINEYVEAKRGDSIARLTVLPINYVEYSRLMSKPYKRPLKNQAWRLLDNSDGHKRAELVVGPIDNITKYVTRYVKRPRAIILDVLSDGTSLDGYVGADKDGNPTTDISKATQGITCELDPILHPEILQRAVELAKASYSGDLQSQIALGQASQTNIGAIQASK